VKELEMTDIRDRIASEVVTPTYDQFLDLIQTPPANNVARLRFTPEVAHMILENNNGHNRSKDPNNRKKLARQGFQQTGDTIKFADPSQGLERILLDGQHRFDYCVTSNKPIEAYVVFNLDPEVFRYLDSGKSRTKMDTFQVMGVPYYQYASAAIRWIVLYDEATKPGAAPNRGRKIENDELYAVYANTSAARQQSLTKFIGGTRKLKQPELPCAIISAHLTLFNEVDPEATQIMFDDLINARSTFPRGGKTKKTPVELLIVSMRQLMEDTGSRFHELVRTARIIITFHAYRFGCDDLAEALKWDRTMPYPDYKWDGEEETDSGAGIDVSHHNAEQHAMV
jgi:hypothetical protein